MLTVKIPDGEFFDEDKQEFVYTKPQTITLEHSLLSVSKWEAKWKKAFLKSDNKTPEEMIDYIRCMTIGKNVDANVYYALPSNEIKRINEYIDDKMTATSFNDESISKGNRDIITSELIYYWMVNFNIPFECEKWHLNRLLTLIKVCSVKSQDNGKKMSKQETLKQNREINAMRRRKLHSRG